MFFFSFIFKGGRMYLCLYSIIMKSFIHSSFTDGEVMINKLIVKSKFLHRSQHKLYLQTHTYFFLGVNTGAYSET